MWAMRTLRCGYELYVCSGTCSLDTQEYVLHTAPCCYITLCNTATRWGSCQQTDMVSISGDSRDLSFWLTVQTRSTAHPADQTDTAGTLLRRKVPGGRNSSRTSYFRYHPSMIIKCRDILDTRRVLWTPGCTLGFHQYRFSHELNSIENFTVTMNSVTGTTPTNK
jgi:hypothetical protein